MNRNNKNKKKQYVSRREIIYALEGQKYGKVMKAVGNCHFIVELYDEHKTQVNARLKGSIVKKTSVRVDDIVLIETYLNYAEIIHQYRGDEKKILEKEGFIPIINTNRDDNFDFNGTVNDENDDEVLPQREYIDPLDEDESNENEEIDIDKI